jgi:hypothetical protein
MLQLSLNSENGNSGQAQMYIDYSEGSIGFTVVHQDKQFDFTMEEEEWEQFKSFIEQSMKRDVDTQTISGDPYRNMAIKVSKL